MITPIIMESDLDDVAAKILTLKERKIDRVHIDIGDGMFSEMISISPADLQEIDTSNLKIDIHLLVDDPTEWIEECITLNPDRVIGQIERMGSQELFLDSVANYGKAGGLALSIDTPIEEVEEGALKKARVILLLAIPSGTTGSQFDERVLNKIRELRQIYDGNILIDGGINKETYKKIIKAGASEAGANSAYWKGTL